MARAPVPKVTVRFQVGSKTETIQNLNQSVGEVAADYIFMGLEERARRDRLVDAERLKKTLPIIVENEYTRGIEWAADSLAGRMSPRGAEGELTIRQLGNAAPLKQAGMRPPVGELIWRSLSGRTIKKKTARGRDGRAFFVDTGSLRKKLKAQARAIVKRAGKCQVVITSPPTRNEKGRWAKQRYITLANMEIRLLSNIPQSMLPGLATGDFGWSDPNMAFERRVIRSPEVLKKLTGPEHGSNRPFLQPVFTYWTQFYVPTRIAQTIQRLTKA